MLKGLTLRAINGILTVIRKLTTGKDNETPDIIRIGGLLLGLQFLILAGWSVFGLQAPFDAMGYGTGAAAILAAIGAALKLKASDEPTDQL